MFKQQGDFNSHLFPLDSMLLRMEFGSWIYSDAICKTTIKTDLPGNPGIMVDKTRNSNLQWATTWMKY